MGRLSSMKKIQILSPNNDAREETSSENSFFPASVCAEGRENGENSTCASSWASEINFGQKQVRKTVFFFASVWRKTGKIVYVLLFGLLLDRFLELLPKRIHIKRSNINRKKCPPDWWAGRPGVQAAEVNKVTGSHGIFLWRRNQGAKIKLL